MSGEVKTVPVQEPVLRGFEGAIKALNKAVEDAIRAVDPEAEVAPVFDRSDPIESSASLLKSVDQNVAVLRRLAEAKSADAEKATAIAARLAKSIEHSSAGHKPCKACAGEGRIKKSECEDCAGEGWVEGVGAAA